MRSELLLKAADVVEKVDPASFCMADLETCIIGHCREVQGFEALDKALDEDYKKQLAWLAHDGFEKIAARFFDISFADSQKLFEGSAAHTTPDLAAQALRTYVAFESRRLKALLKVATKKLRVRKPKRIDPATPTGFGMIERAVGEALDGMEKTRALRRELA